MTGPTAERIDHYIRLLEEFSDVDLIIGENLSWTVVRGLPLDEVVRRLNGDPGALTAAVPAEAEYDDETAFVEQRGDAVVLVSWYPFVAGWDAKAEPLRRLSERATVHSVFWTINNFNRLYYAVDGDIRTELDVLLPQDRWGTDPEALNEHLDALLSLRSRETGPWPDWETAMATMESVSGVRLDAEWFRRPQTMARLPS